MKKRLGNILVLLSSIVFIMLFFEILFRFSGIKPGIKKNEKDPKYQTDNYFHHMFEPNKQSVPAEWLKKNIYYKTNSLAMRDRAVRDTEQTPGKKRILFLGDSFTEGLGVEYENTYVAVLEKLLAKDGLNIDVLNGGVSGYSPFLEYRKLEKLLENFSFDMVVLMLDESDIGNELRYRTWDRNLKNSFLFRYHLDGLYNVSAIFRYFYYTYSAVTGSKYDPGTQSPDRWFEVKGKDKGHWLSWNDGGKHDNMPAYYQWGQPKEGIYLVKKYLNKIRLLLKEHDIPFIMVIYPYPASVCTMGRDDASIYEPTIVNYCTENNIKLINLFKEFKGFDVEEVNTMFLHSDVHWSAKGHNFIANKLYTNLKSMKLLKVLADSH